MSSQTEQRRDVLEGVNNNMLTQTGAHLSVSTYYSACKSKFFVWKNSEKNSNISLTFF
jgi:hypothetical protein